MMAVELETSLSEDSASVVANLNNLYGVDLNATVMIAAYDEYGKEIARDRVSSFGETDSFMVECDKDELLADGEDMIFVEISALDEKGNFVANANNRVNVSWNGRWI